IDADGALSPLAPGSVTVANNPIGLAIAPGGQVAYVLNNCIDKQCDGEVAQYTFGPNGTLSTRGATTLTDAHVLPVAMLFDNSGSSAYLLANLMGVDTNTGAIYQYSIDNSGGLVPYNPPSLSVASGAVAEGAFGTNLYALSSNALGFASGS